MNPLDRLQRPDRRTVLWWALAIAIMLGAYSEWVYPHRYFRHGVDAGSFGSLIPGFLNFFLHAWRFPLGFGAAPLTPFAREVWFTLLVSFVLVAPAIYGGARMARWKNPPGWRTSIKLALFIPLSFLAVLFSLGVPLMSAVLESEAKEPEFYAIEVETRWTWDLPERLFPKNSNLSPPATPIPANFGWFDRDLNSEAVSLYHPDGKLAAVLVHLRSPSPLVKRSLGHHRIRYASPPRLPQAAVISADYTRYYLAEETPALLRAFPSARKAWEAGGIDIQGLFALLPPGHQEAVIPVTEETFP